MNISNLSFEKRLEFEDRSLKKEISLPENKRIVDNYIREDNTFILQFSIKNESFTLKCILDRVKRPNCYWVGPAPDHRFYKNDNNGEVTPNKKTNLANTRFGIYSFWYTPDKTIIDIIERIKHSMTPEGEKEMSDGMY